MEKDHGIVKILHSNNNINNTMQQNNIKRWKFYTDNIKK